MILFQLLNGFVWGWILALIALGLSLIYGILRIINLAHGAFYMLGAVLGWYLAKHYGFCAALLFSPLIVGAVGILMERITLRPIHHRPVMSIIATFGMLLIFQQLVLMLFGGAPRSLETPAPFSGRSVSLLGVNYPSYRLFVGLVAIGVIMLFGAFLRYTLWGLWIRAVHQNQELALTLGIPVPLVYSLSFGLGSFFAALAGVLTAPIVAVEHQMGLDILIEAFIIVIVGGAVAPQAQKGNLTGAVIAAVLFRVLEGLFIIWADPLTARILALTLMGLVLLFRPEGLLQHAR